MSIQELTRYSSFQLLSFGQMDILMPYMVEKTYKSHEIIFVQNEFANVFYILTKGSVIIRFKPYDGPPMNVTRIPPGGVFGWSAALNRPMYSASAVALSRSTAYGMRRADLERLIQNYPETGKLFLHCLAAGIAERIGGTRDKILTMLQTQH